MILSGEKKEEYRDIKEYYETRFQNLFGAITIHPLYPPDNFLDRSEYELLQGEAVPEEIRKEGIQEIIFRNGYSKNSKEIKARCRLRIGKGRPQWELLRISSIIFWKSWIRKNWQQMRRG